MSFEDELGGMSKEKFRIAANKLLNQCYLLKKRDDTRNDYIYVLMNKKVFSEYFDLLGYFLKIDETQGVIGLSSIDKSCRLSLRKYESILLLILRLMYAEARSSLSLNEDVIVTIEDIQRKYSMLNIKNKQYLDKTTFEKSLRMFKKYNIADKLDAEWTNPETRIKIYPSILFAVSAESIDDIYEETWLKLKKYEKDKDEDTDEEDMQNTVD